MGEKLVLPLEQFPLVQAKIYGSTGVYFSLWNWIGDSHHQFAVLFGGICTVITVLSFIKSWTKK